MNLPDKIQEPRHHHTLPSRRKLLNHRGLNQIVKLMVVSGFQDFIGKVHGLEVTVATITLQVTIRNQLSNPFKKSKYDCQTIPQISKVIVELSVDSLFQVIINLSTFIYHDRRFLNTSYASCLYGTGKG